MKIIKSKFVKWALPIVNGVYWNGYVNDRAAIKAEYTNEVPTFEARFFYKGYGRGCSSTTFTFVDADNNKQMFEFAPNGMSVLLHGISNGWYSCENGMYSGVFTFKKQGQNIYTVPVEPK